MAENITISPELWKRIKAEHTRRKKQQINLISNEEIWKLEVERKLASADKKRGGAIQNEAWFVNFFRCGRDEGFVLCASCLNGHVAPYRCSQKWCPSCNWRISMKRRELLEQITRGIPQLKHVVLTQKNFSELTPTKIDESREALFKLRRQNVFDKKPHGCASLEFTNEGNGWHLHWHLLLTQKWIDAHQLAIAWGKLVKQEFAIVKIRAVDGEAYLNEVCKYVVKASEFVKWSEDEILQFIEVIRKKRCFSTFGKFREIAASARQFLKDTKKPCNCSHCGGVGVIYGNDEAHCHKLFDMGYF